MKQKLLSSYLVADRNGDGRLTRKEIYVMFKRMMRMKKRAEVPGPHAKKMAMKLVPADKERILDALSNFLKIADKDDVCFFFVFAFRPHVLYVYHIFFFSFSFYSLALLLWKSSWQLLIRMKSFSLFSLQLSEVIILLCASRSKFPRGLHDIHLFSHSNNKQTINRRQTVKQRAKPLKNTSRK